ncbi:MAG: hypothetical protein WCT04_16300 [Planctomycetota bacterium]
MKKVWGVRGFLIGLAAIALVAAVYRYAQPAAANGTAADEARTKILGLRGEWVKVTRGDFEIAIQEDGELRPVKVTSLTFLIPGKIDLLVPEGKDVKKGDAVIALETKDLREEIQHSREDLDTAETALAQQIQTRDLEAKRLALEFHTELENAEYAILKDREIAAHPNAVEKEQAQNILESAKARLESAKGDLDLCKPLFDNGFYPKFEYDLKVIALEKARIESTRADMQARILFDGALSYDREKARCDLEFARLNWKCKLIENDDVVNALTSKVKIAERAANALRRKLAKRELELERSTLHAPHDGVVVYRTMGYRNHKKPEVGERVSPWIAPIDLPNYDKMKVRTQVPESLIRKTSARVLDENGVVVQPGSTARVQINTLPGILYPAHVIWIDGWARDRNSKLSDADIKAQGLSGVKVFDVEVELDVSDPKHLREGFRASVDFPEETLKNVIAIPEQAVSTIDSMSSVMVKDGSTPVVRKIEIGRSSLGRVAVLSGLNPGERIYVPTILKAKQAEAEVTKNPGKAEKKSEKKPEKRGPPKSGSAPSGKSSSAPTSSGASAGSSTERSRHDIAPQ